MKNPETSLPTAYTQAAEILGVEKKKIFEALTTLQALRGSKGSTQGARIPRHEAINQLPTDAQVLVALAMLIAEQQNGPLSKNILADYYAERRDKLLELLPHEIRESVRLQIASVVP